MKKIISSFLSLFLLIGFFSFSNQTEAQNTGSLRTVVNSGFSFKMDLREGDTDPAVLELQKVLNTSVDTMVATAGAGSLGQETTYFGAKTKAAVIKFQEKYKSEILTPVGLTAGTGLVGKMTRTKLNNLIGVAVTLDSVGSPQGRVNVNSTTVPYVPPVTTPTQPNMTPCQFVELLININAIVPAKANAARGALNCIIPTVATASTSRIPSVDIRVNGRNGTLTINSPREVTVSWTSANVTSCTSPGSAKPVIGSMDINITASETFAISCTGPYGQVFDSVSVRLVNTVENDTNSLSVSCSANPAAVNLNSPLVWVATVTGATSTTKTYSWTGTDGLSSTNSSVSKTYTTAGAKAAAVSVTAGSLTASAACNASVTEFNTASSTLAVTCSAVPSAVGVGDTTTWSAYPTGGTGNYTYSWSEGDSSTGSSAANTSQTFSKSYDTPGLRSSSVVVTSGSLTASANCSLFVTTGDGSDNDSGTTSSTEEGSSSNGSWTPATTASTAATTPPAAFTTATNNTTATGTTLGYLIGDAEVGDAVLGTAVSGPPCIDGMGEFLGWAGDIEKSSGGCNSVGTTTASSTSVTANGMGMQMLLSLLDPMGLIRSTGGGGQIAGVVTESSQCNINPMMIPPINVPCFTIASCNGTTGNTSTGNSNNISGFINIWANDGEDNGFNVNIGW